MSSARHARADWHSWAMSETADAVLVDSGGASVIVTVCNRSFRRSAEPHEVVVRVLRGEEASEFALASRGCATVSGNRIEVVKPEGQSFAVSGRYKIERRGFFSSRVPGPAPFFERRVPGPSDEPDEPAPSDS
jgi:hypothetical protein